MFYQLPTKLAEKYSLDLMNELESTDLMSGFEGMFGVLVCKEKNEDGSLNEKDIVLLEKIILEKNPDYSNACKTYFNADSYTGFN